MSGVNEWLAREYFESLGYLTRQPVKYVPVARDAPSAQAFTLVIHNPQIEAHALPGDMLWGREELKDVGTAVVHVCGWHTERIYATMVDRLPELGATVRLPAGMRAADTADGCRPARIMCLPRLPASDDLRSASLDSLREKGVDGVILFRSMLVELIRHVSIRRNYEKSIPLQVIRLLKNYDLLKDNQMELFRAPRRSRRGKSRDSGEASAAENSGAEAEHDSGG